MFSTLKLDRNAREFSIKFLVIKKNRPWKCYTFKQRHSFSTILELRFPKYLFFCTDDDDNGSFDQPTEDNDFDDMARVESSSYCLPQKSSVKYGFTMVRQIAKKGLEPFPDTISLNSEETWHGLKSKSILLVMTGECTARTLLAISGVKLAGNLLMAADVPGLTRSCKEDMNLHYSLEGMCVSSREGRKPSGFTVSISHLADWLLLEGINWNLHEGRLENTWLHLSF